MRNRKVFYLAEGECEEKLIKALKMQPPLILPGSVKKFNVVQEKIKESRMMQLDPGSEVVLVFDTDIEETEILKQNIELLKKYCARVEVLTVVQVLNFEDEIERATDVDHAPDFTRSASVSDFKSAVNRMKDVELRRALKRHKLDMSKLWAQKPPKAFRFVSQDGEKVKEIDS